MRLVLLGLPGAGKGTQGELISEKYGIPHISTGEIIRKAMADGGSLGRKVNKYVTAGELIPDDLAIEIVYQRLNEPDCAAGWLLDGFPRTVPQAQALDECLRAANQDIPVAFDVRITMAEAIRRITLRRTCSQCGAVYNLDPQGLSDEEKCKICRGELVRRADDQEETVMKRLEVYHAQTHPVVHYYAGGGRLYSIDGARGIEAVFQDVDHYLWQWVRPQSVGDAL